MYMMSKAFTDCCIIRQKVYGASRILNIVMPRITENDKRHKAYVPTGFSGSSESESVLQRRDGIIHLVRMVLVYKRYVLQVSNLTHEICRATE